MVCTIRPSNPDEVALILRFIRALADHERLDHQVAASEADLTRDLFGEDPRVFCDIAEWDGAPAGFALWYYTYSTFRGRHGIWLEDLFVEQAYRGNGIGKALMASLAARCARQGLGRLEWWVLDWNAPSIDFYRGLGAELMDEWRICRVEGAELAALGALG